MTRVLMKMIFVYLVEFYGISTIVDYLMLTSIVAYIKPYFSKRII